MIRYIVICVCAYFFITTTGYAQASRPLAVTLAGVYDYSTEVVFSDVFKQSRPWFAFDTAWSSGINVPLMANGYPLVIPYNNGIDPPQYVRTVLLTEFAEHEVGMYRLIISGHGTVALANKASGIFQAPCDTLVSVNNTGSLLQLDILYSESTDPISDIKLILPTYVNSFTTEIYNDKFLNFLEPFQCLRLADWHQTNNSAVQSWGERGLVNYQTQCTPSGVAYEYSIGLCNQLNKDLWINVPHKADDAYVQQLASLIKTSLAPQLRVHVEYSYEVWNGDYAQFSYAASQGSALGFTGTMQERAWQYYARRSAEIFAIFRTSFADTQRVINVLSGQLVNDYLANTMLNYFGNTTINPSAEKADVYAVNAYVGSYIADNLVNSGIVATATEQDLLDSLRTNLSVFLKHCNDAKATATSHGLVLRSYEGGQHLVASAVNNSNAVLTQLLKSVNRNSGIKDVYCKMLSNWFDSTQADMFCHYHSTEHFSRYGSWGLRENQWDTLAPKYLAISQCGSATTLPAEYNIITNVSVMPNPTNNGMFTISMDEPMTLSIYNTMGQLVPYQIQRSTSQQMLISTNYRGIVVLVCSKPNSKASSVCNKKIVLQ
jgi:hypothetical protein